MMDYETIKTVAKETGVTIADLCALAPNNDPFYTGRPSEVKAARWFADLWQRFGYTDGVHLRRVHYRIVSQDPPVSRPDGTPYENTDRCWNYLCNAGKWARYLDLVDAAAFVDKRNPEPTLHATYGGDPSPGYEVNDRWGFDIYLPDFPDLPTLDAAGYTNATLQPYHVEVWVEKTTMDDVLDPLCQGHAVNLVTGAGELSISAVVDFLERAREADRPARILYISDYDPAGLGMPISVARKIEFYHRRGDAAGLDIRLHPIVLTADQVDTYSLPRVPVKDSDKRKAGWVESHGPGQVELDALEALHPGELARIVEEVILQYHDPDLTRRAREQRWELQRALNMASSEVLADLEPELARLRSEFDAAMSAFEHATAGICEALPDLHDAILERLVSIEVGVDDYPLPEADLPPETGGTLYDSGRDYLEQLDWYKAYRDGEGN